jgi:hypothetical protein
MLSHSFCQSLSAEVDNIYNFSPNKLTRSEQEGKIKYLDEFWNKVKFDSSLYLGLNARNVPEKISIELKKDSVL